MEEDGVEVDPKPSGSGSKRTWTMRSNAARQVAVNFVPSRQLPYNTIQLKRNHSERSALLEELDDVEEGETEDQAEIIVREMEQHDQLMEDNPQSEELRREALRDLPQCLTMKRNIRAKLSASVSRRSKQIPISMFKRLKYRTSFAFKRMKDRIRNCLFSIEIWHEAIRKVEGHFGSAVGSYFHFLRWLFLLDLVLMIMVLCFVVVPQVLYDAGTNGTEVSGGVLDFICGKGMFEDTVLFFGHYGHAIANSTVAPPNYNMAFAYFYTMLSLYVFMFVVLCYRTAHSYRSNFISYGGGLGPVFAGKVLCGWDFGIATSHAATLNARSIYNEFKELLSEQTKTEPKSFWTKLGQKSTNVLVSVLILVFIVGLEFGFWRLLAVEEDASGGVRNSDFWPIVVTVTVTLVVAICPVFFSFVVRLEYYKPRTALYVTLCRTFFLDISTLILFLVFWSTSGANCWETSLGQEMYRFVLIDAFFSIIVLPFIEFLRCFIYKTYPKTSPPEFSIAYNSLILIYNQALLWMGLIFSPLLVVMVVAKFVLLFYVKRECVMRACQPARKVWRAAQTQTVLFMLVNLSLFATLFSVGTLFLRSSPKGCGPFQGYPFVYSMLSEGLLGLSSHPGLITAVGLLTKPGVIGFLLMTLCVWVYYTRARSIAQQSMVSILRNMLLLERKDKDFLLAAIGKVSNGEWMYLPKQNTDSDHNDSHTWKYLNDDKIRKPSNAGFQLDSSRLNQSLLDTRPRSYVHAKEYRPNSLFSERPKSYHRSESKDDGDTDSSFSWKGSGYLSQPEGDLEDGNKKWL